MVTAFKFAILILFVILKLDPVSAQLVSVLVYSFDSSLHDRNFTFVLVEFKLLRLGGKLTFLSSLLRFKYCFVELLHLVKSLKALIGILLL